MTTDKCPDCEGTIAIQQRILTYTSIENGVTTENAHSPTSIEEDVVCLLCGRYFDVAIRE
jgi:hypothetical protein